MAPTRDCSVNLHPPFPALRRSLTVTALAAVALIAAACSSTINGTALEQEVAAQLAAQQQLPASEVSVDCPEQIDVSEGSVTRCTATLAGDPAEVDVTQTDGSGTVEWVLVVPEEPPAP